MIKAERNGSIITIKFDHYTIVINDYHPLESLFILNDRDERNEEDIVVEAISDYDKQFVVYCVKSKERMLIDYKNPDNCKYVEPDNNGSIELKSIGGLEFMSRYSEKKVDEDVTVQREDNSDEQVWFWQILPSFIKKEVFIILNDRILMYHLPFMGKVTEYMLTEDASSNQIHICVDYSRIKGSLIQQTYDGLSLDDKPLPVKAANECELIAKLDHVAYDYMNQVVVKGSDGAEIYIDTYGQNASFVNDPDTRNPYYIKLNDMVSGEVKDFKVGDSFDHNRFIYQTAI